MKLAIISGGSKGLGKSLVAILKNENWQVKEISRSGESDHNIELDLKDASNVAKTIASEISNLSSGSYEEILLINNAGTLSPIKKISALSEQDILNNLNVNIVSSLIIMQAFIKQFRDHDCKKTIVSISSGAAKKGYAGWGLYCTSKAACENFINSLVEEERNEPFPFGAINFNPGIMDTGMQTMIRSADIEHFPQLDRFIEFKDSGYLQAPEAVAQKIIDLIFSNDHFKKTIYSADEV